VSRYVIDASIAVKWIFEEEYYLEARRFLSSEIGYIAPDFMLNECTSAIYKKYSRHEIIEETAIQCIEKLLRFDDIKFYSTYLIQIKAFQIASQINHPIFDCFYLALAMQEQAIVVTADRRFYNRVKDGPYSKFIAWVEDQPVY
jgi:predicted nucleic acid-binding protein